MDAHRRLTTTHATALVVANMIGTGVFTTTGLLLADLGSGWWVLAAWLVGGVLALCGAAVYGELGAMMPRAGGEYVYLSRGLHPAVGFLSGWVSLVVGFSAPIAASAIAFGLYLHAVWPAVPVSVAAVGLIAAATTLHMVDVLIGARVQTVLTWVKVLLLLAMVVGGLVVQEASHLGSRVPGVPETSLGAFAVALVFVSFAYSGWNAAAYVAGELREPGRTLPRALLGGAALVTALYVAVNAVFLAAVPAAELAGVVEVGHVAAVALFGPLAGRTLSVAIAIALVSSVSAMVMAGPRVYLAMAEDGLFPSVLARRSASGAPWPAILLQGMLAAVLAVTATFDALLVYTGFTLSLVAGLTVAAAFVLRRREPLTPRPFRVPLWPLPAVAFLALSAWMVGHALLERPQESAAGLATLAVGAALYFVRAHFYPRQGQA